MALCPHGAESVEPELRRRLVDVVLGQLTEEEARTARAEVDASPAGGSWERALVCALDRLDGAGAAARPEAHFGPGESDPAGDVPLSVAEVRRRATVGAGLLALRGLGIRGIALATNLLIARLLLPGDIGLVAIGASVVALGDFLANAGVGSVLIRRVEAPERGDLESVVGLQLAITSALAVVVAGVGLQFGKPGQIAAIMVASLPILAFRAPSVITFERRLAYGSLVTVELLDAATYAVWAIGSVALGWSVWGLATAVVARAVVGTTVLARLSPLPFPRPRLSWSNLRPLLGFGLRFQAIGALNVVRDQGFNFAIAALAGVSLLGLWTLAFRVLQTLLVVFEGLWRVSFPAMSRLIEAGEDARPIIERSVGVVALGSGAFLATLAASGPALIPSVVGTRWQEAADILPASCLGLMIVGPVSVSVAGYLFAEGDAGTVLRGAILHTAAQFAVAVPLLTTLRGWAIGLSGLASCLVEAIVLGRAAARRCGARIISPLSVPLIAATGAGAAGWALATAYRPTIVLTAASGGLALALYLGVVAALRPRMFADCVRLVRRGLRRAPTPVPA